MPTPLLTYFHLFPTLPEELRVQIFEEAIFQSPRIIEICQRKVVINSSTHHPRHIGEDGFDLSDSENEARVGGIPFEDDLAALREAMRDEERASESDDETEAVRLIDVEDARRDVEEEDDAESSGDEVGSVEDLRLRNLAAFAREATEEAAEAAEEEEEEEEEEDDEEEEQDDDEESEDGYSFTHSLTPPNPNRFYTTTPLPPLLHASRLARLVALAHYSLSFPNPHATSDQEPTIYYNPRIDTLYFPSWCFPSRLTRFEATLSPEVKETISSIAIDNMMWMETWDEGSVNAVLQIDEFRNVRELILVARGSGNECGCCMEFEGPEEGIVEFKEKESVRTRYEEKCLKDCQTEFGNIKERVEGWNTPKVVRFVKLLRGGVVV